nr:hypothetical protein [Nitrosomonas nitrosa]
MDRIVDGGTRCTGNGGIMFSELLQSSTLTQALVSYLTKSRSLSELEEWLVGNMQEILDTGDVRAIKIANQVDALLVECGQGIIDEDQFRKSVNELLLEGKSFTVSDFSASGNALVPSEPVIWEPTFHLHVSHSFALDAASK